MVLRPVGDLAVRNIKAAKARQGLKMVLMENRKITKPNPPILKR